MLSTTSSRSTSVDLIIIKHSSAGGIAISETVLVGPNGGELLTATERKLFSSSGNKRSTKRTA